MYMYMYFKLLSYWHDHVITRTCHGFHELVVFIGLVVDQHDDPALGDLHSTNTRQHC